MVLNNILPTIRDNRVAEFTVNVYNYTRRQNWPGICLGTQLFGTKFRIYISAVLSVKWSYNELEFTLESQNR